MTDRQGFAPRIWAPARDELALWWAPPASGAGFSGGVEVPLSRDEGGWWGAEGLELPAGARYGFVLSGPDAPPTPIADPRGRRLPEGVHGPSEVVPLRRLSSALELEAKAISGLRRDASADARLGRRSTEAAYRSPASGEGILGGVIYEAHIGTLTPEGTLDAAIGKLPHLVELGVDAIELLPVNGFNGEWNWGYDGVAWFAVHEPYGGPDAYRRFVAAAHRAGLAVIQDVVYNHLGPSGNHLPLLGPYLRSGSRNTWGDSVNFDEPEVRAFVLDNTRMWFEEYGVDGLRLDAVHALVDPDSPVHILRAIADQTRELETGIGRSLTLIAESDLNDPAMIETGEPTGGAEGRRGMDAQWSDDYHHAVHVALTGETSGYYADFASLDALGKAWAHGFFHDGSYSSFRGRNHGRPIPADLEPTRLVVFDQDHDQIGNRAAGDRLAATLSPARLTIAAVLAVCNPNTPMLFMGEEWGASTPWAFFTSHPEPELGRIVAEGRLREFEQMGWDPALVPDPQDPETFFRSKLDWGEVHTSPHRELLHTYRELLALRRRTPELGGSGFAELAADVDAEARTAALRAGDVVVYLNLGFGDWTVPVDEVLFVSSEDVSSPATGDLTLPPDSAVIARYGRTLPA